MGFFNPGLLWLGLGGAIPIIIHILNRQRYRRIRWAAMEFLLNAMRKTRKRLQFENLLLLLLRIAIMLLLAFALAKPFLKQSNIIAKIASDTNYIFVIDNSYSMGYKVGQMTSLDNGKKVAVDLIDDLKLSQQDTASVILMSDHPDTIIEPTNRKEKIKKAIEEIGLSDYGTSILDTFRLIQSAITKTKNEIKKVYIITDMQRVGWEVDDKEAGKLGDMLKEISKKASFYFVDVAKQDMPNMAIVNIQTDQKIATTKKPIIVNVDVQSFSPLETTQTTLSLLVDSEKRESTKVQAPPLGKISVPFRCNIFEAGPHIITAELDEDNLPDDDRRYLSLDVKDQSKVLAIDGDLQEAQSFVSGLGFFKLALAPTQDAGQFAIDTKGELSATADQLDNYDFLVLSDAQDLSSDEIEAIANYVKNGGGLLISLGGKIDRKLYNELLYKNGQGLLPAKLLEIGGDDKHESVFHLTNVDYTHPIFKIFSQEGRRAALGAATFYEFYKTAANEKDANISVLARFDDVSSSPAIIERKFGDGKVLMLTTTLDMEWNLFAGRPPYLVLANEIAYWLASKQSSRKNIMVGDTIQLTLSNDKYRKFFNLSTPKEGFITLSPIDVKNQQRFMLIYPGASKEAGGTNSGVAVAGVYSIQKPDAAAEEKPLSYFAVNLDTKESDLAKISPEEIKKRFPDFRFEIIGKKSESGEIAVKPPTGNIWKYALWTLFGFLILESILAAFFGRSK